MEGFAIENLGEGVWSVRVTDEDLAPLINVSDDPSEDRFERDFGAVAWPSDTAVSEAIGCPVRFSDRGDDSRESIYRAI